MKIDNEKIVELWDLTPPPLPNVTYDVFIDNESFTIELRTFMDGATSLTILHNNDVICKQAPISIFNMNLNYYSNYKKGKFFLARNKTKKGNPTFLDFAEDNLRLLYAKF